MSAAANANTQEAAPSQTSSAISQEILDRYLPRCKELLSDISAYAASGKKKKGSAPLPNVIDAKLGALARLESRVKAALPDAITTQDRKRLLEIRTLLEGMLTSFGNQVFKLAMLQGIEVPLGEPILAQVEGPLPSPSGATSAAADAFEGRSGQAQAAPGKKNANGAAQDNSADKSNSKSQVCVVTKAGNGAMSGSMATAGAGASGGAAAAAAAAAGPKAANAPAAKPAGPIPHRHYLTASHAAAEQMIRAIDLLLSQPTGPTSPRSPKPQRTTATASNGTDTVGTAAAAAAAAATAGPSAAARVLVSGGGTEKTSGGRASTRTKVAEEDEGDMEVAVKTARQASAQVRVSAAAVVPPPTGNSDGSKSDGDIVAPAPSQRDSMEYWRSRAAAVDKKTDLLREWLYAHFEAPFPSKDEKQALSDILDMKLSQVSTWFINARVRLWKPKVIMIASELASDSGGAAAAAAAGGDGPASPSVKPNKRPKNASNTKNNKSGLSMIARNDTVESPLPIAVARTRRNVKQINYAEADAELEDANAAPADNGKTDGGGAAPHLKPRSGGRAAAPGDEDEEEDEWEGEEEEEEDYDEEELDPEEEFGQ